MLDVIHLSADDPVAWLAYRDYLLESGEPYRHPTLTNSIGIDLSLIPPGKFLMGSPATEESRSKDEGPRHGVHIAKPFYLGIHAVTQAEYQRVMGTNPSWFSATGGGKDRVKGMDTSRFPVEQVSWNDAVEFCRRLSEMDGRAYRLPTEAEWEYACRAGTTTPFYHGDDLSSHQANFDGNYPYGGADKGPYLERTCPVGSYEPNAWGLYDMHGNVWEWCADWYGPYREDEHGSDPTACSRAAAGTSSAGAAGRPSASGASRTTGATTTGSASVVEGEHGSDPTACSRAAAGTSSAGTAGRRSATGASRTTGAGAAGSGSREGEHGSARVLRGGGWGSFGRCCRSAYRGGGGPDGRLRFCGFRLAAE